MEDLSLQSHIEAEIDSSYPVALNLHRSSGAWRTSLLVLVISPLVAALSVPLVVLTLAVMLIVDRTAGLTKTFVK